MPLDALTLYTPPAIPTKHDYGIGIVGAGAIVRFAHLPAYRKAGFTVVGITDTNPDAAARTAREFDVATVFPSVEALLADPRVQIVDIAVPARYQPPIALAVIASGRHLLCQKPLAETFAEARGIVEAAEARGLKIAVNQQMRWEPGIAAARAFVRRGLLGEPAVSTIDVSVMTDWSAWPWLVVSEHLEVMYHSIHYLDSTRAIFGMPQRVYCSGGKFPGQPERAETRTHTVLDYDAGLTAMVRTNHWNWTGEQHAIFRFEGTAGRIEGTLGLMYNYPHGRPDTIRYTSKHLRPDYWFDAVVTDRWIPDAFVGPMASLMDAIQSGAQPETDARDNLDTLRLVFAAYRSMASHQVVDPQTIA